MRTTFSAALATTAIALSALLGACSSTSSNQVGADCKPESTFDTISKGTLSIVGPDYPPLFTNEQNKMGGVDGDVLAGFAKANCLNTKVQILPAAGVIEAVKGGQADVAAGGWFPTAERARVVNLSEPIYEDPNMLVGKNPSTNIDDYRGKRVGTTQGYLWTSELQKWAGDNAKLYASPDAVFQDLLAGRIDVAMMASNEAAYRLSKAPADAGLTAVRLTNTDEIPSTKLPAVTNLPSTKGNDALTAAINAYVEKIRADGTLGKILQNYNIPVEYAKPS